MKIPRRILLAPAALVVVLAAVGCTGSAMTPDASPGEITIGFIAPQTGPYQAIGTDMQRGWDLYLDQHGGKLGGHRVKVVLADEGDGTAAAQTAVEKLLKADKVAAIVGTATAPAVGTVARPATEARVPFVGVGGRPSTLSDVSFVWHTSFQSVDYGRAAGPYVAKSVNGPVYVIGPDYQGGHDQLAGFVDAFVAAGGKLANPDGKPTYTPWPATDNFAPWLAKVRDSGAAAVYAFYAGAPAISFTKQYAQFVGKGMPLYAAGFLTEGAALTAEGSAADGVLTAANYAPGLNNPSNQAFTAAFAAKYPSAVPNVYHVTSYDAAALLDRAIASAGANPTPEAINTAIGKLGQLDSPRGPWQFASATHTPVQQWYLREVKAEGTSRSNVVVAQLGQVG
ncbi:ABC transporter substrate-binding protein [Catellatospora sp. NPDC049133]|uniref:ABC transporter substrate-binding protein n=1 Tax=Catellatospora sp. NPDC049133 TaxID=3155499 RepID=UPI0033E01D8C